MRLEAVKVADAVANELGTDELTAGVPHLTVGGEDAVTQKVLPLLVEGLPLAKVGELSGQDGLDVLWVGGGDDGLAKDGGPAGVAADGGEVSGPEFEAGVVTDSLDGTVYERDA